MVTGNYDEIRRVRHEMSKNAGHDIRKLIATINELRKEHNSRITAPGNLAEQCDTANAIQGRFPDASSHVAAE